MLLQACVVIHKKSPTSDDSDSSLLTFLDIGTFNKYYIIIINT